mgnify:CR=1 FL=1
MLKMLRIRRKVLQVPWRVVRAAPINVVDNFSAQQEAANLGLLNKAMLRNVAVFRAVRVFRSPAVPVAAHQLAATFPAGVLRA